MTISTVGYWVSTGLAALIVGASGVGDLAGAPQVAAEMTHLGYPAYFSTILGTWKILGAITLLVPRFPRLKEWAYAGITFDLSGAAASHVLLGDGIGKGAFPLLMLVLALTSWALRPESRRLASREGEDQAPGLRARAQQS
jgi:uncharacterized membrane protein YphA (DoxX/SURF4 family)